MGEEPEAKALDAWHVGMKTTSGSGSADSAFSSVEILEESYAAPWLGNMKSLCKNGACSNVQEAIKHNLGPLKLNYSYVPIVTGYIAKDRQYADRS